ncbi:hypothetical protein OUZ56_002643 [Daphnia magna]|uniref:Uncharacterized protein n=1 Tax=Daphnia magna TaxID=35525 RepID=A0ABR0A6B5_9CRUS|nr:hypothetical protein OUZ56_002643 [Daphnia magna]
MPAEREKEVQVLKLRPNQLLNKNVNPTARKDNSKLTPSTSSCLRMEISRSGGQDLDHAITRDDLACDGCYSPPPENSQQSKYVKLAIRRSFLQHPIASMTTTHKRPCGITEKSPQIGATKI